VCAVGESFWWLFVRILGEATFLMTEFWPKKVHDWFSAEKSLHARISDEILYMPEFWPKKVHDRNSAEIKKYGRFSAEIKKYDRFSAENVFMPKIQLKYNSWWQDFGRKTIVTDF